MRGTDGERLLTFNMNPGPPLPSDSPPSWGFGYLSRGTAAPCAHHDGRRLGERVAKKDEVDPTCGAQLQDVQAWAHKGNTIGTLRGRFDGGC